jgi:hypothetical protein
MFRVMDQRSETQVFTSEDPRSAGYKGAVEEQVTLEFDIDKILLIPEGSEYGEPCLARSRENAKRYKVFKYRRDLGAAGYEFVASGTPNVFRSWQDYVRIRLNPPSPDEIKEEVDWYDYLDDVDNKARQLRQRSPWPETPKDASRDAVAEWLAKKHFVTDPTIREIWYLPQGAPESEIRFLEVSDRVLGNEEKVEPFDFGLKELGKHFRVSIADVSGDQLERIRRDPTILPPGWLIDGNIVRRRRER